MTQPPDSSLVEQVAKDRADWLLDAIATATQNRRFLRGDPEYDPVAGEAILLNGEKAISAAILAVLQPLLDERQKAWTILWRAWQEADDNTEPNAKAIMRKGIAAAMAALTESKEPK
jgi:hypothetical protein